MKVFEFFVVVSGADPESDDFADRFYEAGCDDATVCVQNGYAFLDFSRKAKSFDDAVESAADDIRKAGATPEQVWR